MSQAGGKPIDNALRFELIRALTAADRANDAVLQERAGLWTVQDDPTEGALIVAARRPDWRRKQLEARFTRTAEVPFSSERKLMSTIYRDAERQERLLALTKGAPDVLLARCSHELVGEEARPLTAERRAEVLANNEDLAGQALRTLGVAFRSLPKDASEFDEEVEQELVFLGLIGISTPYGQKIETVEKTVNCGNFRHSLTRRRWLRFLGVINCESLARRTNGLGAHPGLHLGDGGPGVVGAE